MAQSCVEVISQETMKPSSPTPQHLRKLKLSYLDQIIDPVYINLIFVYQADGEAINKASHVQISQRLKRSFSHSNFILPCSRKDPRPFHHRLQLMDAIQEQTNNINEDHLKQYLPVDPTTTSKPLFLVQVTHFDCGGIVVGVQLSHIYRDGGFLNDLKEYVCMLKKGVMEMFMFTSWCGFPVYEANIGWGKPIWFCPANILNNCAVLVDSRCGEKIEVRVNIKMYFLSLICQIQTQLAV
ncbi:hypothetical protein CASFOL_035007 [Castilleja foliolosa]|uniref:Uncharacterized protein n=1 Tax=Castilleja foliolosa TaxID=1961234 RepID=A0ABD3BTT5_9LAMI